MEGDVMDAPEKIAGKSLQEWAEFARRDDCLEQMVPSDLRQLVGVAARADLRPRVKPLVWTWHEPPSVWRARSILGEYEVDTRGDWTLTQGGVWQGVRSGGKVAAEEYDRIRILAALEE